MFTPSSYLCPELAKGRPTLRKGVKQNRGDAKILRNKESIKMGNVALPTKHDTFCYRKNKANV